MTSYQHVTDLLDLGAGKMRCVVQNMGMRVQDTYFQGVQGGISASADGGPRSWVCARETLRSAPHRH